MNACSILVVDDDPSILDTVADMLTLEGHRVRTANNGREALEVLEHNGLEVVLLDMRMPVMDGWQFAREARARGYSLPIVVMTAAQNAATWAQEIGATAYVAKPFELEQLLETVSRTCRGN